VSPFHDLDRRLVSRMIAYALTSFPDQSLGAQGVFADAEAAVQLFMPWSLYHFPIDGRPVAEWFAADPEVRLTEAERAWLAAPATLLPFFEPDRSCSDASRFTRGVIFGGFVILHFLVEASYPARPRFFVRVCNVDPAIDRTRFGRSCRITVRVFSCLVAPRVTNRTSFG
jgi:hypothetical protein